MPQSAVTAADVASPYKQLAGELDKIGEVTDTLAVKAAESAGANSVSRDANGDLQVQKPALPIVGPASEAFARASRFSYLAQTQPEIENKLTELRLQHPNDPAGYQQAAKVYEDTFLGNLKDPTLRGPAQKIIAETAGQHFRSLLTEADSTNTKNTLIALKSRISDSSNKLADLAFQGGVDTPEYKTLQGNVAAMYGELSSDPRMGYPKDRVDSELSQMTSQHKVMAISGQAVRMMDANSVTARADAKKFLIDRIYGDTGLNLSMSQRHQAVTTAMGLMEARSAENKALIDANKAQVTSLLTNLHSSQPYNPIAVNDAISNAAKIGDAESYYKLTFAKGMHDWDSTVRGLPLPQQMAALHSLNTANLRSGAAGQAMDFFQGRGYTREQAAGIVGNLIHESNLNPGAIGDSGTSVGIGQFHNERAAALKQFAAARGKPVNDLQTQLEFVDHELQTSEAGTAAALKGATTAREAARAFIGYERPQGYTAANPEGGLGFANRVANAEGLAGGKTGAGQAWFDEARQEQVTRFRNYLSGRAPEMVDTLIKRINTTTGVSDDEIKQYSTLLNEVGRDDLRDKLAVAVAGHYGVEGIDKLPESTRRALIVETAPEAAKDNFSFRVHDYMQAQIAATAKAMQETPYSTYAARTGGKPPAAYNFDDPQNVAAVAKMRAGTGAAIVANDRTAPVSVFEGKESETFGNTLTNGDPAVAAQSLGGLASLPTDVYQATLADKPITNAVTGMMGSKDPVRMSAAMQAADKLWRDSPAQAKAVLGDAAITKMQAWQALRGTMNAAEIAERLNASDDPATLKSREAAKDAAEKETKSLTPADMAYKLGTGWYGIGRLTGSTPAAPFDSIKGDELVADYRATYEALRTYGVDADKASDLAVQRLQSTWGVSASAGNQVMKNPPERAYPQIDGSHDWIAKDLNDWIVSKAGPERKAGIRSLEAGPGLAGEERNWTLEGLISDGQTQAEMGAGRPASYQVAIRNTDGTLRILDSRVAFDPSSHISEHEAQLNQRRQAVDFLRAGQFANAGMPQP